MHRYTTVARLPVALGILLILAACGGGGGGNQPAPPAPTFAIGGTVSGVASSGLVLQLNGGNSLTVAGNGSFAFPTQLASGSSYVVTAAAQPLNPSQACSVANGTGTVANASVNTATVSCVTPVARFAASLDFNDSSYSTYVVDSVSGQLRPRGFGRTGRNPVSAASDPSGRVAVVLNRGDGTLSSFVRDPITGTLSEAPGSPYATGAAPINIYSIDQSSGALLENVASKVTLAPGASPGILSLHPSARFAYVTNTGAGTVAAFTVAPDSGALTPVTGSPFTVGPNPALAPIFHPSGRFLYVRSIATLDQPGALSAFTIDQISGALAPMGPALPVGANSSAQAIDPAGRFLFVASRGALSGPPPVIGSIEVFRIGSDGALTALAGLPSLQPAPFSVSLDPSGTRVLPAEVALRPTASSMPPPGHWGRYP